MSTTTTGHTDGDLRCAEYALGVLDADERRDIEQEMEDEPRIAAEVAQWQQRLGPLAEEIDEVAPPAYVWARIAAATNISTDSTSGAARKKPGGSGLWNNLRLWRWIGVGASGVAAACVIALLAVLWRPTAPTQMQKNYMVSSIQRENGTAGWTATMDIQHGRMVIVSASPAALPAGKVPELWLIPPGQKPISLGVIGSNKPTQISLSSALLKQLSAKALLAVSVEPPGGSPTGQPTGPVIAKGHISGA